MVLLWAASPSRLPAYMCCSHQELVPLKARCMLKKAKDYLGSPAFTAESRLTQVDTFILALHVFCKLTSTFATQHGRPRNCAYLLFVCAVMIKWC